MNPRSELRILLVPLWDDAVTHLVKEILQLFVLVHPTKNKGRGSQICRVLIWGFPWYSPGLRFRADRPAKVDVVEAINSRLGHGGRLSVAQQYVLPSLGHHPPAQAGILLAPRRDLALQARREGVSVLRDSKWMPWKSNLRDPSPFATC